MAAMSQTTATTTTTATATATTGLSATSFALDRVRRSLARHLSADQVSILPDAYPDRLNPIHPALDCVAASKILKSHLEDAFPGEMFYVTARRRIKGDTIQVSHGMPYSEQILDIASAYEHRGQRVQVLRTLLQQEQWQQQQQPQQQQPQQQQQQEQS